MKKAILIVVMGLLWCNVGFAQEEEDKFSEFESQSQRTDLNCQYILPQKIEYHDFGYDGKNFFWGGTQMPIGVKEYDPTGLEVEIIQKGKKPIFLIDAVQYLDPEKSVPVLTMKVFVDFKKKSSSITLTTIATGKQEFRGQCYIP